jgi:MFS superfamily sulfate permease-like transporter
VRRLAACTPGSVTAGIQLALGLLLVREGLRLALTEWPLALISLAIIVTLRRNRHVPAAPVLLVLGLAVAAWRGELGGSLCWGVSLPRPALFSPTDVWRGMVLAGFAQVALTLTNAVIATSALIREYWPERSVCEERLALSTGLMNLVAPFLGGMPMCHGAGGLAAQHYFGARTAGANILEGIMEVFLGLFLATSVARVFGAFPAAILGTMLLAVAAELGRLALRPRGRELVPLVATTLVALVGGTAAGFAAGLATHYLMKPLRRGAA